MDSDRIATKSANGLGFSTLLGLIFITLKLTNVIAWSWWLILLPLYLLPAIALVLLVLYGIFTLFNK